MMQLHFGWSIKRYGVTTDTAPVPHPYLDKDMFDYRAEILVCIEKIASVVGNPPVFEKVETKCCCCRVRLVYVGQKGDVVARVVLIYFPRRPIRRGTSFPDARKPDPAQPEDCCSLGQSP